VSSSGSPLLARFAAHAERAAPAIVAADTGEGGISYATLLAEAVTLGRALVDRHGGPLVGARVALLVPSSRAYVVALLAVLFAGGVAVPLSSHHTPPELAHAMAVTTPAFALCDAEHRGRLETSIAAERFIALDAVPTRATELPAVGADDAALVLFTSGTTGKPKGVVLSHRGIAATLAALESAWSWRSDDRLVHVLPLHHTHGVIVALLGALWAGARAALMAFDAPRVLDALADATLLMTVPTMVTKLLEAMRSAGPETRERWRTSTRALRLVTCGSAALPASLLDAFESETGQRILERYGMTEIGMALSNEYEGPRIAGAVGRELPGVSIDIVGDDGALVARGEAGELRVRSPQMFTAYLGDPDATAAAFDAQGRFRTGDTGVRDDAGIVRLLGRTSTDVLKSGGYKLSAIEIEDVLREHPAIAEVAVIGVPDATWGDLVTACVVLRAGATLDEPALRAFCKDKLAGYKQPRALVVRDALPRTPLGKVQKKELIAAIVGQRDAVAPRASSS
jgi:malonyl-CoA/methylmalonyl-CoA synthetase